MGEAVFTNGDLDRIVENRLARELKKRGGDAERKRDALEAGVEALRRELLAESQTREDRF